MAGAAGMTYSTYFTYDVIGGILWISSMILGGYGVGKLVPEYWNAYSFRDSGGRVCFPAASGDQRVARPASFEESSGGRRADRFPAGGTRLMPRARRASSAAASCKPSSSILAA